MALIGRRMAILYGKAIAVILVLCFTITHFASIGNRTQGENKLDHLERPIDESHDSLNHEPLRDAAIVAEQKNAVINVKQSAVDGNQPEVNGKDKRDDTRDEDTGLRFEKQVIKVDPQAAVVKDEAPVVKEEAPVVKGDAPIVKEEALLLGQGDHGPPREQIQEPKADDVIVGNVHAKQDPILLEPPVIKNDVIVEEVHGDSQIDEPKEKLDIQHVKPAAIDLEHDEDHDDDFPAHNLKDVRKMRLDDLQLPDHMDGVRLEIDGHLNKQYRKEIILGNHEEFDRQSDQEPEKILEQVFDKVDKNSDHFISLAELEEWIIDKVQEHFDEANDETERIFNHLDNEKTGLISWHDFHVHFLVAKGYDDKTAQKHATDYETIPLNPDEKERLIRYKFRWAEADEEPQDNKLNLDEYKAFRHPEQSKSMMDRMVQDIIDNLDQNNDGEVTEEEFVALPPGEMDGVFVESDRVWQEERRKEYSDIIDIDRDGKVTKLELKNYVDPKNPNHARLEAENLLQLADDNKDDQLSLDEVLDNSELFLGSKMVDTGRNFHDEF